MEFYWPASSGEWAAWVSALTTIGFGLLFLFAPRLSFRIIRITTVPEHPEALAEGRGTMAGFYLGLGLCCILFAQPMLWVALGVSWGFTAFGGNTLYNWISIAIEIALAALPLLFAFGFLI